MTVAAKLKKVFDTHLDINDNSSRSVQRVAALWIGHSAGKIEPEALRTLCDELGLFEFQGRKGDNNFGANFTQNMKKDISYFDGDHKSGWKLTAAGKAEAKSIFEDGQAPTRRRVEGGKPRAAKAAKAPKAAKAAKKAEPKKAPAKKAAKPAAKKGGSKKAAPAGDEAARKREAKKRALQKKRDLGAGAAPPVAPPVEAPAGAPTA